MKKTIISFMTSMVVLSMLIMTPVKAAENAVVFTTQNDQILVTLNVTDTNKEALTMKASFQIKAQKGSVTKENIQFHFDQDIKSVVKEYRYDNTSNILTIYISGQNNILSNQQVKLGTIDFNVSKDTKIDVALVKDSIEYVSSAYYKDVLESKESQIEWGESTHTPTTPDSDSSNNDDQNGENIQEDKNETPTDSQKPSVDVDNEAEDLENNVIQSTDTENTQNSSSQIDTSDSTNIMIYAWMALGSIIIGLFVFKFKIKKQQ